LGFHDDFGVRHLQYGLTITRTGIDWTVRHGLGSFSAPYTNVGFAQSDSKSLNRM
jgi:hypothetical protein